MSGLKPADTKVTPKPMPKRVLVVEDSSEMAEAMKLTLVQHGHQVEVAVDGREALKRFKPGHYDLVITDYNMPRMNGVEMAEIIRRRASDQPIMMVTAFAFTIAAFDGRPLPVDRVLHKPFKPEEFEHAVNDSFTKARRGR
jgi:DNA-binding response OmpR family regulator